MTSEEFLDAMNDELERRGFDELLEAYDAPIIPAARYLVRVALAGWISGQTPEETAAEIYNGFTHVKNKLFIPH